MRVDRLTLKNFTAFEAADLEFSPGLNVLIGANGTGKSHILKVLYSILMPLSDKGSKVEANQPVFAKDSRLVWDKLFAVFRPEAASRSKLGQGGGHSLKRHGATSFHIDARGDFGAIELDTAGGVSTSFSEAVCPIGLAVFVPPSEILSMYPGFVAAYERRELSFDETFRDLCVDLSANPLRSVAPPALAEVVARLDDAVGGKTVLRGDRFYVSLSEDWLLEAPLLAEGLRKLATIAHLVRNGSLMQGSVLFWDEPEASLNPNLIPTVAQALLALAGAGIQVFVATHDFLLSNELSLAAEYETEEAKRAAPRFFAVSKADRTAAAEVEWGATLADLRHNSILEEFAAHYDREHRLFAGEPE